ncbi:hypothetical protein [Rhodopirellula europaea]|uniref:Putative secreted protein n=1 Tax=Rhodopirellula europaea SH398 TaxID=1263868 RepID=M5S5A7_9BACT|nr:hypothetical protein [Rhodopirellula europaea]EMI26656.1 putative secreted protein [Rhodopirellula europaea SH398]
MAQANLPGSLPFFFRSRIVRGLASACLFAAGTAATSDHVHAQGGFALPSNSVARGPSTAETQSAPQGFTPRAAGPTAANTPPSLQTPPQTTANRNALPAGGAAPTGQLSNGGQLPREAGQEHRVYNISPYTGYLTKHDRPHQAIVDWIVRETGTDVWHTEPFGFMSADRDELKVYHTNEMHQVIGGIVERFVAGDKEPQVMNLRLMTVGNPNWRSNAHMLMQHVNVQSPGLQAWLLTKENAALVMNMLRSRTDVREVQAVDLITNNGQTEKLASTRGRNYVLNVKPSPANWPPYEPETGEIQEGFQIEVSPLLSVDGRTLDCVINANIDQVDKFVPVELDLPLPNNQVHRTKIEVPQLVSWRLHERFRWPSDMVLLLSCGVVASPERPQSSLPLFNLSSITGTTAGRADALMFVEFRGRASDNLTTTPLVPQMGSRVSAPNRGRY